VANQVDLHCLFCRESLEINLEGVHDTRFGIPAVYHIARCTACGLEQTVPLPTLLELKSLYADYYNFGGEKRTIYTGLREWFLFSPLYRLWLGFDGDISFHDRNGQGRLIDIGCNEGRGLVLYRNHGFEVEGLETNEIAASVARAKGFRIFTDERSTLLQPQSYDVAVLSNVLEHAFDPREMLSFVHRLLRPGGQVWISCPNAGSWLRGIFGQAWINWHVPFHLVHFSKNTLATLLRKSGFEIQEARQKTPALWVAHSLIARLFARPGKPTKQLRDPFLIAPLALLIRGLLFPVLWLGNRLGRGDCLVVVAKSV
jgi:SAM-dependent methyltransferase